jgi:hypothetical protein
VKKQDLTRLALRKSVAAGRDFMLQVTHEAELSFPSERAQYLRQALEVLPANHEVYIGTRRAREIFIPSKHAIAGALPVK